ncbi:MAG: AAA family ATPase [Bacteroidetes bacterium]|nr:AAA family ATPase [Bacteroidota bacterium]
MQALPTQELEINDFELKTSEPCSYELFDSSATYINCMRVYYFHFRTIASIKVIHQINHRKAIEWLELNFSNVILKKHGKDFYSYKRKKMKCVNVIYVLKGGILVDIEDNGTVCVLFQEPKEHEAQNLIGEMKKFKRRVSRKKTTDISLVVPSQRGLSLVDALTKKPKLEVAKHYNDDLLPLHENILQGIGKRDNTGLILFHGIPGTGKSTYIRYLIHCQKKRVIFLPPRLAGNLDSPELVNLLLENRNSILVIEDAEDLLVSRDTNNNSGISMLLNLTDGILGESLAIQVICTFNTHVSNIDKALLRKGRLMALYEFKALVPEKAKVLLEEIGVMDYLPEKAMTLAELYNIQEDQFQFNSEKRNKIGFMAQVA